MEGLHRIVLAAVLLLLSGGVACANDFKTCASGAPDDAIMACTNLIEGGQLDMRQQAIAYTKRGAAFRIRGGLQRALADLNRAIELDSSLAPIYANRGLVYMYMGEPDPALADLNRALELDPNNPVFYLNRGAVYQRLKDKDRALADYDRAIEL
ncbi:MAG TPA: tetratricopeptide repeat protein, partial [Methyloceanibacter sp.]|nr:tetratricopeptide repeat protein [Methyloceanibacter sp.]